MLFQPATVLQYADDTLIIARAMPHAAQTLRQILYDFALATGLAINFHKTTFVPIHTTDDLAQNIATTLGTPLSSFPQTYLGLPLSSYKLPVSAFQPLFVRIDMYLAGWCAALLSKGGRLVLLSVVLDSLPTNFMSSVPLPMLVIQLIDKRRCTFLWSDDEHCYGA
jgi:hypothetical protein